MEIGIPLIDSVVESFETIARVWHICRHKNEILEFHRDRSTFVYMLLTKVECYRDWFDFGQNGRAWVTFLSFRAVPILAVPWWYLCWEHLFVDLLNICLSLIQAENSGAVFIDERLQLAFFNYCIHAVNVPAPDIHHVVGEIVKLWLLTSFDNLGAEKWRFGRASPTEERCKRLLSFFVCLKFLCTLWIKFFTKTLIFFVTTVPFDLFLLLLLALSFGSFLILHSCQLFCISSKFVFSI